LLGKAEEGEEDDDGEGDRDGEEGPKSEGSCRRSASSTPMSNVAMVGVSRVWSGVGVVVVAEAPSSMVSDSESGILNGGKGSERKGIKGEADEGYICDDKEDGIAEDRGGGR
jgi:hypothetical protein